MDEFNVSAEEISYTRKQLLEITIYELRELDDELGRITSLETHWRRTAKDVQDILDEEFINISGTIRKLIVRLKEVKP